MALVKRENVVLDIKDDQLDRYLSMGYCQIDDKCRVIKESTKKDVESLLKRCAEQEKKINALEGEIKEYLAAIEMLNNEIDALNDELDKLSVKNTQPKTTKSRKKSE